MSCPTSWFRSLSQRERKNLVCLLFEVRGKFESRQGYHLFLEFLRVLDGEYHALKRCCLK